MPTPVPGASLLSAEVKTMVSNFAASLPPTAIDLLTLIIPIGLTLFGIGFGIKKGIGWLQSKLAKTV
ncbi:MAG: hypothetical protein N2645_06815 [Clostridia bacterium]|nr:hypothetical protein [Clostridia bacterium]